MNTLINYNIQGVAGLPTQEGKEILLSSLYITTLPHCTNHQVLLHKSIYQE